MSDATRPETPGLEPCGVLVVEVGEPVALASPAAVVRRAVPVLGGSMSGEIGEGVILSGWDRQTVLPNGVLLIDATYPVRLLNDDVVTVTTVGTRHGSADGALPYFRLAVTIEGRVDSASSAAPLLVASGVREAGTVTLEIYRVT